MRSRTCSRVLLMAAMLAALALLGAAARAARPAPFGDQVAATPQARGVVADAMRVAPGGEVQAYERRTGAIAWSYARDGRRALRLVRVGGTTVAVWDDGMLTGMEPGSAVVRWHRYVPGVGAHARLTLVPLGDRQQGDQRQGDQQQGAGETFLVLTHDVVVTYNTGDGTLRGSTLPPLGCSYSDSGPAAPVHLGAWVVARRDCADGAGRTQLEGFNLDGRRWQQPSLAPFLMRPTGGGAVAVFTLPRRTPLLLDPATGRSSAPEWVCAAR